MSNKFDDLKVNFFWPHKIDEGTITGKGIYGHINFIIPLERYYFDSFDKEKDMQIVCEIHFDTGQITKSHYHWSWFADNTISMCEK